MSAFRPVKISITEYNTHVEIGNSKTVQPPRIAAKITNGTNNSDSANGSAEVNFATFAAGIDVALQRGYFVETAQFDPKNLPTAMRKVYEQIAATLRHD